MQEKRKEKIFITQYNNIFKQFLTIIYVWKNETYLHL